MKNNHGARCFPSDAIILLEFFEQGPGGRLNRLYFQGAVIKVVFASAECPNRFKPHEVSIVLSYGNEHSFWVQALEGCV
jgi:hypothetical protein